MQKRRLVAAVSNVLFGIAVVLACGAFVWIGVQVKETNKPVKIPVSRTPHSFVWGDRVPLSDAMFKAWLGKRGGKFRAWAKAHPAAAKRLAQHNLSIVTR